MISLRTYIVFCGIAVLTGLCACSPTPDHAASAPTITVFAAASLTDALEEVAEAFREENTCPVRFSFASSSTLARQIAAGAGADIFISAHPRWMRYLEDQDALQADSRRDLLSNQLVCIASKSMSPAGQVDLVQWLRELDGRLSMGDPQHVPAGIYGKQALLALNIWDEVEPRLAPAPDTRTALRAVELGQCSRGIVYATDAASSDAVYVVARMDTKLHDAIRYPAALTREASPDASVFLDFLGTPNARAIFERHGFTVLDSASVHNSAASGILRPFSASERHAAAVSIRVALLSVAVLLLPGVFAGWAMARTRFPGKFILETLIHLPMVVPPVVTGYVLLVTLGRNGYIGRILDQLFGFQLGFTVWAAVIASAVTAFPLIVRAIRVAVELVPGEIEEAAAVSGAGPLWRFLTVTIPLAGPGILAGVVLAFTRSLGEFGATMTFAGNIPQETQTIPLAIYSALQVPGAESAVFRLAAFSILLCLVALMLSRFLEDRMRARYS